MRVSQTPSQGAGAPPAAVPAVAATPASPTMAVPGSSAVEEPRSARRTETPGQAAVREAEPPVRPCGLEVDPSANATAHSGGHRATATGAPSEDRRQEVVAGDANDARAEPPAASADVPGNDPGTEPRPEPERRRRPRPSMTLADYIDLVRGMAEAETAAGRAPGRVREWLARTKILRKKQRAHGTEPALRRWTADRAMQLRETPLPA